MREQLECNELHLGEVEDCVGSVWGFGYGMGYGKMRYIWAWDIDKDMGCGHEMNLGRDGFGMGYVTGTIMAWDMDMVCRHEMTLGWIWDDMNMGCGE